MKPSGFLMADDANQAKDASLEQHVLDLDVGARVDRFLALRLDGVSRSRVQALMREGHVTRAGEKIYDPSRKVKLGESYQVLIPEPVSSEPKGEDMALDVIYEDDELIVIDKPAGLVVHPAAGHESGTLVNALIAHCGRSLSGIGGVRRPGIVHRLDKGTSGLLVVAKTDRAHQGLSDQFAAHGKDGRLMRAYLGVCWRVPSAPKGKIDAPLGRSSINRQKMAVVAERAGRRAVTHYSVERTFSGIDGAGVASLVRFELETGRTHQIRVHMTHIRHPLLGDPVYGGGFKASARGLFDAGKRAFGEMRRQALHAYELGFEHPVSGQRLLFRSELPSDMARLVDSLELVDRTDS